jgi:hypothetical protein
LAWLILPASILFAQKWERLPLEFHDVTGSTVYCMQEYQGDLYIGGDFTNINGVKYGGIVKFNGFAPCSVGKGISDFDEHIYGMTLYNGSLIVWGIFRNINTTRVNSLASYDGNKWSSLGPGLLDTSATDSVPYISNVFAFNNELYVFGIFNKSGNQRITKGIAKWNGKNWIDLKKWDNGPYLEYKNELYHWGSFNEIDSVHAKNIARWNGIKWDSVGSGISSEGAPMAVANGKLYSTNPPLNKCNLCKSHPIGVWDGQSWDTIPQSKYPSRYLFGFNGLLYAFTNKSNFQSIVYMFDGNSWIEQNALEDSTLISFVSIYQNQLYAEGFKYYSGEEILRFDPNFISLISKPNYQIYPNPVTTDLTISILNPNANMYYEIYNCAGQKLQSGHLSEYQCCQNISFRDKYSSGLYFIRIKDGSTWYTEKIEFME